MTTKPSVIFELTLAGIRATFEVRRVDARHLGVVRIPPEPPSLSPSSRLPAAPRAARRWRGATHERRYRCSRLVEQGKYPRRSRCPAACARRPKQEA